MANSIRVTVTGAAGNVGYALIFRIAAGALFGPAQAVDLVLLEIPQAVPMLEGVALELEDCAFPLLSSLQVTSDPWQGFDGTQYALLVGSKPRTRGAERNSLIADNLPIFVSQGQALNARAAADVRVTVVGNPANLNCLIAREHAPDIPTERFTALTRLDHNRTVGMVARHAGVNPASVTNVAIWGNHSATQYPCISHALIQGHRDWPVFTDDHWLRHELIPRIRNRGAEIIAQRGQSSAASAAHAILGHVRNWHEGTPPGDSLSMALMSQGEYGTPPGVIYSFPVTVADGDIQVVPDLVLTDFDRRMIEMSGQELLEERGLAQQLMA